MGLPLPAASRYVPWALWMSYRTLPSTLSLPSFQLRLSHGVDRILNVVGADAAVAERACVVRDQAVLRLEDAGGIADVEQLGAAPILRRHQIVLPMPVHPDVLARLGVANGRAKTPNVGVEVLRQSEIIGECVEVVERGVKIDKVDRVAGVRRARIRAVGQRHRRPGPADPSAEDSCRIDVRREGRDELARVDRIAELVVKAEAATKIELGLGTERLRHGTVALVGMVGDAVAVLVKRQQRVQIRRLDGARAHVEARDRAVARLLPIAIDQRRHGNVNRRAVVEELDVEADEAGRETARQVGLQLTAVFGDQLGFLDATAIAVKAADMELPVVAEVRAIVEVEPRAVVVDTAQNADRTALDGAVLGNEVDDRAGRVACRCRCRAAANRLDAGDVVVGLQKGVGGRERNVAEQQDGDAVLLELDELSPARSDRQTADRDIGVTLAARGLGPDAGNKTDQVGGRLRRDLADGLGVNAADGDAGIDLALRPRGAGDDDLVLLCAGIDRRRRAGDDGRCRRLRRQG